MKHVQRFLFTILIVTFVAEASAQTFVLKGGLNLANMVWQDEDGTYSDELVNNPGFHLGAVVDIPISETFSFEPGLLLSTKGFKLEESYSGYDYKMKANLYFFDVPLNIKAAFDAGNASIYATAGPYIGVGLSGKTKSESTYQGQTEEDEEAVIWGNDPDNDDLKRFDGGVAVGAGVEFNSFLLGVSYWWGLANASPYTEFETKYQHRVLEFSIGYILQSQE